MHGEEICGSDLSGGWFAGKELKTANYGASAAGRA
jgi:hypothetical protein